MISRATVRPHRSLYRWILRPELRTPATTNDPGLVYNKLAELGRRKDQLGFFFFFFCQEVVFHYHSLTFFSFCLPISGWNAFHMSVCVQAFPLSLFFFSNCSPMWCTNIASWVAWVPEPHVIVDPSQQPALISAKKGLRPAMNPDILHVGLSYLCFELFQDYPPSCSSVFFSW